MPLFGSDKFSPKRSIPRRSQSLSNLNLHASEREAEFGLHYGKIKVNLSSTGMTFDQGQWIPESIGGETYRKYQQEATKLKKHNNALDEENNLLKLKVELLLDKLCEDTAQIHLNEHEIKLLRKMAKRKGK